MGYINPLLRLPAGQKLLKLPKTMRQHLEAVLRELREQSDDEAEKAWSRRKGPMASYWRAVSTYARHTAHALSKGTGENQLPPVTAATLDEEMDCTVAICRCGGAVVMAVTSCISDETKLELGEAAADGCDVRHMTLAETRLLDLQCRCTMKLAA